MSEFQPHQQRVVDEQIELDDRLTKLHNFIDSNPIFGKLPVEEQCRLKTQAFHMGAYCAVLEQRVAAF